jgi:hypothetical protein
MIAQVLAGEVPASERLAAYQDVALKNGDFEYKSADSGC